MLEKSDGQVCFHMLNRHRNHLYQDLRLNSVTKWIEFINRMLRSRGMDIPDQGMGFQDEKLLGMQEDSLMRKKSETEQAGERGS